MFHFLSVCFTHKFIAEKWKNKIPFLSPVRAEHSLAVLCSRRKKLSPTFICRMTIFLDFFFKRPDWVIQTTFSVTYLDVLHLKILWEVVWSGRDQNYWTFWKFVPKHPLQRVRRIIHSTVSQRVYKLQMT